MSQEITIKEWKPPENYYFEVEGIETLSIQTQTESSQGAIRNEGRKGFTIGGGDTSIRMDYRYGLWIGKEVFANAPFSITMDGSVVAKDIDLTGATIKYQKTSFTDSTNSGYWISSDGIYLGAASDATYLKYDISSATFDLKATIKRTSDGAVCLDSFGDIINSNLNTSTQKILTDFTFTDTDYAGALKTGTVEWNTTTGRVSGGTGIVINDKGIMGALDGTEKFTLLTDGTATFAGSLSAASGTFAGTMSCSGLTSGTITSKQIILSYSAGQGDCYIAAGKTDFTNVETGFILGFDSDTPKLLIGNSSKYFNWDGSDLATTNLSILNSFTTGEQIIANEMCFILPANKTLIRAWKEENGNGFNFGTPVNTTIHNYPKWSSKYLTGPNQIEIKYLSLYLLKYTGGGYPLPTDSVRITLQTDNGGSPSGTVIGEFDFEKNASDIAETLTKYSFTVTTPSVIEGNSYFHIVVERTGDLSKYSAYSVGGGSLAAKSLGITGGTTGSKYWDGDSWEIDSNPNVSSDQIAMSLSFNAIAGYVYRASAFDADNFDSLIFTAYENKLKFTTIRLNFSKVISGFTGLTLGSEYYLTNEPGSIATTAGNVEKKVGKAFSTTGLIIY